MVAANANGPLAASALMAPKNLTCTSQRSVHQENIVNFLCLAGWDIFVRSITPLIIFYSEKCTTFDFVLQ